MVTKSFTLISILLLTTAVAASRTAVDDQTFVKPGGWNLSSLQHLKTKSQSQERVGGMNVNIAALLVPEEGILFEDTAYYLNVNGNRTLNPGPMNAYYASRFDVNGHVFCYTVRGPGVAIQQISKTEKEVAALGCESFFAFYDEDGDGKFETLVPLPDRGPIDLHVPSWAQRYVG
jgi:hypothetical protein